MAKPKERHNRFWDTGAEGQIPAYGSDCDRILYSSAFRRLSGVTQVVSANETELFHTRLIHSQKVAQVGVRITKAVEAAMKSDDAAEKAVVRHGGGPDSRVVRAACFAHDLGHPPFGHIAEDELQRILRPEKGQEDPDISKEYYLPDSFEGNAQSFRIVTKLSFRETEAVALNLTRATLSAILKYPWTYSEDLGKLDSVLEDKRNDKWGAYDSEKTFLDFARGTASRSSKPDGRQVDFHGRKATEFRTIEAQIMDWADDITYAVHDIEDFYRAGFIPLDLLKKDDATFDGFIEAVWPGIESLVGEKTINADWAKSQMYVFRRNYFPAAPYAGTRSDREGLHTFAKELILRATEGFRITDDGLLLPNPEPFIVIEVLKKMTKHYVIKRPGIGTAQRGQALLIRRLYRGLLRWASDEKVVEKLEGILGEEKSRRIPKDRPYSAIDTRQRDRIFNELQEFPSRFVDYLLVAFDPNKDIGCVGYTPKQRLSRAVVDYIVSLTEAQAIALDGRLNGSPSPGSSMLERWLS